jgi:uncharacterized membrane protein (DUF373 family)
MGLKKDLADARASWAPLSFYEKFEHACILILTALIALIIALAIWNLVLKILISLLASTLDPTDYAVFQALFGMIFTVIIALEFKRSLLVLAERVDSVVQVRAVLLIALLAVVRKLILLDLKATDALQLLAPPPPSWRSAPCTGWFATRTAAAPMQRQRRRRGQASGHGTPVDRTQVPGCHAPPEPEMFRYWRAVSAGDRVLVQRRSVPCSVSDACMTTLAHAPTAGVRKAPMDEIARAA